MAPWILVASGSALGGLARYALSLLLPTGPGAWPSATMSANFLGSFLIGVFSVLVGLRASGDAEALRLFWMAGVLGGFTTYSAFALETVLLVGQGVSARAGAYVLLTVFGGAALALLGRVLAIRAISFWEI